MTTPEMAVGVSIKVNNKVSLQITRTNELHVLEAVYIPEELREQH